LKPWATHKVDVVITGFVLDHQPNIVEWRLVDIYGTEWMFGGKCVYVTEEWVDEETAYPVPGEFICQLVEERVDDGGVPFYRVRTYVADSIEDVNIFDVRHVKPVSD
jgi:hypothetical protein